MRTVLVEPLTISQDIMDSFREALGQNGNSFTAYETKPASTRDWLDRVGDADQVILANSPMPEEVVESAKNLKYINVAFTGLDHIPLAACKAKGIQVSNAAGYSDEGVAELVVGMTISLLRQIKEADRAICRGGKAADFLGGEVAGRTVGIIGTGKIGTRVAQVFQALGARLVGYNRSVHQDLVDMGMDYLSLEDLLRQSDIVTVHLPQNEETRNTITAKELALMKETAILINCARGPIVNSKDLSRALAEGKIAGAGVDVFDREPPLDESEPLLTAPNVLLTPHVAYFTQEAMAKRADIVLKNAQDFLEGRPVQSRVL
ncbi:MAG: NAD(P)-dependent oxidoreductase [Firmicutes bacterium]|nr:NAD(P)-dependent oxidoreductase [Bacillota bacterium]